MTLTTELTEMRKRIKPETLGLEALLISMEEVTEEKLAIAKAVVRYQNRDKMPEQYLPFADLYHELTGQEPTKRVIQDWMMTFEEWRQERLEPEHIKAAFLKSNNEQGFPVGRPGALTITAVAMKTKMTHAAVPKINTGAIEATKQLVEEKQVKPGLPANYEELRANAKAAIARARVERGLR